MYGIAYGFLPIRLYDSVDDSYRSLGQTVTNSRNQIDQGKSDRKSSTGSAISGGLSRLSSTEKDSSDRASSKIGPVSYHRGGKVRKGGNARLLKGERVISRGKRKKVERLMKRAGMTLTNRKQKRGRVRMKARR